MTHSRELAAAVAVVVAPHDRPPAAPDRRRDPRVPRRRTQGSLDELMERAGTAVADVVDRALPGPRRGRLRRAGTTAATAASARGCCASAAARSSWSTGSAISASPDVIVDALLGIGLKDAPREDVARMIERINGAGKPVVAVDVPSGVNASTGEVPGAAVRADATVTFGAAKVGLVVAPGRFHAGSVHVAPIGLEPAGHEHALARRRGARRGSAQDGRRARSTGPGSVLVVGGSRGLTGRADARGARRVPRRRRLRHGRRAGVVAAACSRRGCSRRSSAPLPEDALGPAARRAPPTRCSRRPSAPTRSCSGPGLGRSDGTRDLVRILLEQLPVPVVLDADALWELEPFERAGADRDDAARRRARAAARDRGRRDRRAPARVGAAGRVALRRDGAAEGRRHARRLAARGRARRRVRRARRSRPPAPATCSPA